MIKDVKTNMDDTIFALSSAKGKSGVAVFRISGIKTRAILKKISNISEDKHVRFRTIFYGGLHYVTCI